MIAGRTQPIDASELRWKARVLQLSTITLFLLSWQFIPEIPGVQQYLPVTGRFFISSPEQVASSLFRTVIGDTTPVIWGLLFTSMRGIVLGGAAGLFAGMLLGLLMSHWPTVDATLSPFFTALNATPRLALIPIVIVVLGPTATASTAVTALVVFLVVFFSALAGGRSVPEPLMLNAYLLGAGRLGLMRIRWRYVTVWTVAVLPNVLATAFIAGITTELLSGSPGLGRLVRRALETLDATRTMVLVVFLSVIGGGLSWMGRALGRRWLHWHEGSS